MTDRYLKRYTRLLHSISAIFLSVFLCTYSYAEVRDVEVENKGDYTRITLHLDRERGYRISRDSDTAFKLEIDDVYDPSLSDKGLKGEGIVESIKPVKSQDGKLSFKVFLAQKILMLSDFSFLSPPKIVINIRGGAGKTPPAPKVKQVKKAADKVPAGIPGNPGKAPVDKTGDVSYFAGMEGFEDFLTPSISEFVEIFDSEDPLSVYFIDLPPLEALPDYAEFSSKTGGYDTDDPELLKAAGYIDSGAYKRAITLLENKGENGEGEVRNYLVADALFAKGVTDGDMNGVEEAYRDLADRYPESKYTAWALMQIGKSSFESRFYTDSIETFRKVVDTFGGSSYAAAAKMAMAKSLSRKNRSKEALKLYKEFIEDFPSNPLIAEAVFYAAKNMSLQGRHRKASLLFKKACQRWPDYPLRDPEILMEIGESYYNVKEYEGALKYFNRIVNLYPDFNKADYAMARAGDIYLLLGKTEGAKKVYGEIERRYPGSDGAIVGTVRRAGMLAANGGDEVRVMQLYRSVYEDYHDNPMAKIAHAKAGEFLKSRGRYSESFDIYNKFLHLYPRSRLAGAVFDDAVRIFSLLLQEKGKGGDCLAVLELSRSYGRFLKALEGDSKIKVQIADCYFRYGQYKEAAFMYGEIDGGEDYRYALYMKGKGLYQGGDMTGAVESMLKFKKHFKGSKEEKEVTYLLAGGYEALGKYVKAASFYRESLGTETDKNRKAETYVRLGSILRGAGRPAEASADYRSGIELYPPDAGEKISSAYFLLGESLYDLRMFVDAIAAYETARGFAADKRFEEAQYKLALCYKNIGEAGKARALLEELSGTSEDPFWSAISKGSKDNMI